jgi:hypothetical protein
MFNRYRTTGRLYARGDANKGSVGRTVYFSASLGLERVADPAMALRLRSVALDRYQRFAHTKRRRAFCNQEAFISFAKHHRYVRRSYSGRTPKVAQTTF